jgi:uncharacterized membrane protein YphA (DoxX/SURF4 family)
MDTLPLCLGRLAVTAFFAVAFLQSGVDKILDRKGNLDYFTVHFAQSPLRDVVPALFWIITALETLTGICCALGALLVLIGFGTYVALFGIGLALLSLFCLFVGQRLAKDYAGAAILAAYYAVALLGLVLLGWKTA